MISLFSPSFCLLNVGGGTSRKCPDTLATDTAVANGSPGLAKLSSGMSASLPHSENEQIVWMLAGQTATSTFLVALASLVVYPHPLFVCQRDKTK